jgi:hypothetical protein
MQYISVSAQGGYINLTTKGNIIMALTDEGSGFNVNMPVVPAYGGGYGNQGGFGFGGDSLLWVILILCLGGGWGGFGGFGMGGAMAGGMLGMDMLYPWLNNSQNINDGFRDQQLSTQVSGIQQSVTSGFGDVQTALCGGFAGVNAAINNAQMASMERSFAAQTANTAGLTALQSQLAQCCCDNRAATADLKYTVATEECATRSASAMNTRDIIDSQTRGTQAILDKLCALELDGVKAQLAQAQRENVGLQNAVNMATMQASQTAQTAAILQGQNAEVDALYNRLKNCPVSSVPVYGSQPIFTCQNNGCGCGSI